MKNPKDDHTNCNVQRCCRDRRKLKKKMKPYPGALPTADSPRDEARSNMNFIWTNSASESRYSDGRWPVLYTARKRITAYCEVGYHLQEMYAPSLTFGKTVTVSHVVYGLKIDAAERSFMHCKSELHRLCETTKAGYKRCSRVAQTAMKKGAKCLAVPSARRSGQTCNPIFDEAAVKSLNYADVVEIVVSNDLKKIAVKTDRLTRNFAVSRKY